MIYVYEHEGKTYITKIWHVLKVNQLLRPIVLLLPKDFQIILASQSFDYESTFVPDKE
jgi:hypothetical protein